MLVKQINTFDETGPRSGYLQVVSLLPPANSFLHIQFVSMGLQRSAGLK